MISSSLMYKPKQIKKTTNKIFNTAGQCKDP